MMMNGIIISPDSRYVLQAIWGQDWRHPLVVKVLKRLHWLVQYHDNCISFYWVSSNVDIRGTEKASAATKEGLPYYPAYNMHFYTPQH